MKDELSEFQKIKQTAEENGWACVYADYGIGHDSHYFWRDESLIAVDYRSSRPVAVEVDRQKIPVADIYDALKAPSPGLEPGVTH